MFFSVPRFERVNLTIFSSSDHSRLTVVRASRKNRFQVSVFIWNKQLVDTYHPRLSGVRIKKSASAALKSEAAEALEITEPVSKPSHTSRFVISTAPVSAGTLI